MNDAFCYFINSCSKFLDFLVQEHSFCKNQPKLKPPECCIEYRTHDFIVDVIYEYDDFPWMRLTINGKDISLDKVIKDNWPDYAINRKKGPTETEAKMDFVLGKYSKVIKDHLSEIMKT